MKSGARDEGEGKWHAVKGKIKEITGKLSDDEDLEAEVPKHPSSNRLISTSCNTCVRLIGHLHGDPS